MVTLCPVPSMVNALLTAGSVEPSVMVPLTLKVIVPPLVSALIALRKHTVPATPHVAATSLVELTTRLVGTNSYDPISQPPDGRATPRWSVVMAAPLVNSGLVPLLTYTQLTSDTPSMALLPLSSAMVCVGPPLLASAEAMFVTALAVSLHDPSDRSFALAMPPGPLQSPPASFVRMLLLRVTVLAL